MLQAAGGDIVATDPSPPGKNPHGFQTAQYCTVESLSALEAVRAFPNRAVFCSWPTQGEQWAADAFREIPPGQSLALICDGRGGISGTNELFDLLERQFERVRVFEIPQFPGVHDRLIVFRHLYLET
jgi:hypothetical protein